MYPHNWTASYRCSYIRSGTVIGLKCANKMIHEVLRQNRCFDALPVTGWYVSPSFISDNIQRRDKTLLESGSFSLHQCNNPKRITNDLEISISFCKMLCKKQEKPNNSLLKKSPRNEGNVAPSWKKNNRKEVLTQMADQTPAGKAARKKDACGVSRKSWKLGEMEMLYRTKTGNEKKGAPAKKPKLRFVKKAWNTWKKMAMFIVNVNRWRTRLLAWAHEQQWRLMIEQCVFLMEVDTSSSKHQKQMASVEQAQVVGSNVFIFFRFHSVLHGFQKHTDIQNFYTAGFFANDWHGYFCYVPYVVRIQN